MLPNEVATAVAAKAAEFKVPEAHLKAVVEVESAGRIFARIDGKLRPMILFEPHIFYRRLSGVAQAEAVRAGLASKKASKRLYGKTQAERWAQIEAGEALLKRHKLPAGAARESASYGVGQVMGYHWKSLGYASLAQFLKTVDAGVEGQVEAMMRYIRVNNLDDELRDGRWAAFARGYNGPAYRKNKYDTKMEEAADRYGGKVAAPDGMLRMGAKGMRVRELQTLLGRAGYYTGKIDGDYGTATKAAVIAFQRANRITPYDGVYGPKTEKALAHFRQGVEDKPGEQRAVDIDEVKQGAGGVAGGAVLETLQNKVDDATIGLQQVSGFEPWLGWGLTALSIIALLLALWGAWRMISGWLESRKTVEA